MCNCSVQRDRRILKNGFCRGDECLNSGYSLYYIIFGLVVEKFVGELKFNLINTINVV